MFYDTFLITILFATILVSSPSRAATTDSESTHYGKFVSVTDDKLLMTDKNGKHHSHTLAPKAKVTCDGSTCKAEDLKTGMRIRVTTRDGDKTVVTRVEAIKEHAVFDDCLTQLYPQ